MKRKLAYLTRLLAATVLALLPFSARAQVGEVKRIVFLGDSITYAGDYVKDVDCWLLAHGKHIEVLNLGLPSETASDLTAEENAPHKKKFGFPRPLLSERLQRVLAATRPDLVFACYGMNDGSSLPANDAGFQRFQAAIRHLRDEAARAGVKRIVLVTPPVFDAKAKAGTTNDSDPSLARYSAWLLEERDKEGWLVVDVHGPMRAALDAARQKDPRFVFSKDCVHPGPEGHWLMAREILNQFAGAKIGDLKSSAELFTAHGPEICPLATQRMTLLRDAWLTHTRHQRPGLPKGLPLAEAEKKADELAARIQALLPDAKSTGGNSP